MYLDLVFSYRNDIISNHKRCSATHFLLLECSKKKFKCLEQNVTKLPRTIGSAKSSKFIYENESIVEMRNVHSCSLKVHCTCFPVRTLMLINNLISNKQLHLNINRDQCKINNYTLKKQRKYHKIFAADLLNIIFREVRSEVKLWSGKPTQTLREHAKLFKPTKH